MRGLKNYLYIKGVIFDTSNLGLLKDNHRSIIYFLYELFNIVLVLSDFAIRYRSSDAIIPIVINGKAPNIFPSFFES